MTIEELFHEALAQPDKAAAERWLEGVCQESEAENCAEVMRSNLAYFAGYCTWAERERIFELFGAAHPIFGHRQVTAEEALRIGYEMGRQVRDKVKPS